MPARKAFQFDIDLVAGKTQGVDEVLDQATQAAKGVAGAFEQLSQRYGKTELVVETKWITDASGFKTAQVEYKEVNRQAEGLVNQIKEQNRVQKNSLTNLRGLVRQQSQARDSLRKYNTELDGSGRRVKVINREWLRYDKQVQVTQRRLRSITDVKFAGINFSAVGRGLGVVSSLAGKVTALAGAWGVAAQAVVQFGSAISGPIIQRTKQVQGLQLALETFGIAQEDVNAIIKNSQRISLTYGTSLETVEKAWKRVGPAVLASGGSISDTETVIKGISARMVSLGLNTEQSGRYVEAFAQVMGKGKLQGEELNQQFAELDGSMRPLLASFLKTRYGITDLQKAMEDGQVTADIFREFMVELSQGAVDRLSGSMTELAQRIYDPFQPATLAQIEGFKEALNTISVEGLAQTFSGLGRELNAIGLYLSQFFANLNTQFPNLSKQIGQLATILGGGLRVAVVAIGNLFLLLLKVFDLLQGAIVGVLEQFLKIPGVKPALEALGKTTQFLFNKFQDLASVDPGNMEQFSDAAGTNAVALNKAKTAAANLTQQLGAGTITQEQYEQGMRDLATAANASGLAQGSVSRAVVGALQDELKAIGELKTEAKNLYTQKKNQLNDEKNEIENNKRAALNRIQDEINGYNQLKAAILDRYAEEDRAQVTLNREAKQFQLQALAFEQDKLRQKIASGELSDQEVLNAKAQLKLNEARGLQLKKDIGTMEDVYDIEQKSKKATEAKKAAEEKFGKQLDANKTKASENEKQYKDTLKALSGQETAVKNQIEAFESLATETGKVKSNIQDTAKELNNLKEGKVEISIGTPAKALGGPVTKGTKYTVNEFGQEMFMSLSGALSTIKAPAWGKWRAPQAGIVIPADLTKQIRAANNPITNAFGSPAVRNTQSPHSLMQNANRENQALTDQVGKLTQAVNRMNTKDWKVDVRIDGKNASLLDQLNHRR